jgi:hypothetical protein
VPGGGGKLPPGVRQDRELGIQPEALNLLWICGGFRHKRRATTHLGVNHHLPCRGGARQCGDIPKQPHGLRRDLMRLTVVTDGWQDPERRGSTRRMNWRENPERNRRLTQSRGDYRAPAWRLRKQEAQRPQAQVDQFPEQAEANSPGLCAACRSPSREQGGLAPTCHRRRGDFVNATSAR